MSHNATGYDEDMNPDLIDGIQQPRDQWSANNVKRALAAEAIVARLDPSRIVYHHSSGNLGSMHTMQLLHEHGPDPGTRRLVRALGHAGRQAAVHLRVHGALHLGLDDVSRLVQGRADLRQRAGALGILRGRVELAVPGDRAYRISEAEKKNLRWEAEQFRAGGSGIAGIIPYPVGSPVFDRPARGHRRSTSADNWRAFRTWGVSAISPWEYSFFWSLREGVDKRPQAAHGRLGEPPAARVQPGLHRRAVRAHGPGLRALGLDPDGRRAGHPAQQPGRCLAYIAGKPAAFTSKDHNFYPGETVEKQIIVINNSRETVTCRLRAGRLSRRVSPFSGALTAR